MKLAALLLMLACPLKATDDPFGQDKLVHLALSGAASEVSSLTLQAYGVDEDSAIVWGALAALSGGIAWEAANAQPWWNGGKPTGFSGLDLAADVVGVFLNVSTQTWRISIQRRREDAALLAKLQVNF